MKRIIYAVLIVGALVAGWAVYARAAANGTRNAVQGLSTEPAFRGELEALVTATGSVRAERAQRLAFSASGVVAEVLVQEGEQVTAGQALARLDDSSLALGVQQAQAALVIAQAQLARTTAGPSPEDIAVAEASLAIAQVGVQTAEAGVALARANLGRVQAGASPQEIAIATRRVEEAKNALWAVQAQRDAVCGRVGFAVSQADCDQAQASVQRSEQGVGIAELQLQQITAGPRSQDVASAQAQVRQAQSQLESARAQVARTQAELARALRGASPEDIAIAEAQVAQARVNVEIAQRRLEDATLRAPAAGRIAGLALLAGDAAGPGAPVATLVDSERHHVVVNIDETEIGRVQEGQQVRVILDAYPGEPIEGTVNRISLTGANIQGIVVFEVHVDLTPGELAVRPLMTASVDIIVARRPDTILVSSRALRRDAQGRYVEVVEGNEVRRVQVEVGETNVEYAEILSGLEEGQQVVVGRPRMNPFAFPMGGG